MEMLELTPDMLLRAYAIGVFPMAEDRDDPELFWIDPRMRSIIPLDDFHIPRRLRRLVVVGAAIFVYSPSKPLPSLSLEQVIVILP